MVSRKNFQQNGRTAAMQRMRGAPYKKNFKPPGCGESTQFNQIVFTASQQMPDNPGYMDFSINPVPPTNGASNGSAQNVLNANAQQKKKNNKNRQKNKQSQQQDQQHQPEQQLQQPQKNGGSNWNKNKSLQGGPNNSNRFNGGGNRMHVRNVGGGFYNGPNNGGRGRRIIPPRNMRGLPPMPPMHGFFHPPIIPPMIRDINMWENDGHFKPRNKMPPMMVRGGPPPMVPPPPPYLRRGGQMPAMIAPPMAPMLPLPMPFNGGGKSKKINTKSTKKIVKGKNTIKTLKSIANQYPLDKPWVTEGIRAEHQIKVDIENRLKGNKDDDLFAQFKAQRDKFVGLYETAREEYLKNEAAAVKSKEAKDKQTNDKTATTKDANNEEIAKKSLK